MAQYVSIGEASTYFESRLHSGLWGETPISDRTAALRTATRMIDQLNFIGEKAAAYSKRVELGGIADDGTRIDVDESEVNIAGLTQELQFPRGTDTEVPIDIENACCELAYALLDGRDADEELEALAQVSRGFSTARSTSDRTFVQEHLNAGIPSASAWRYLRRYLRDGRELRLSRVS